MKRRNFISKLSIGTMASFFVAKIGLGAKINNPSPLTDGKNPIRKNAPEQVCNITRRVYKVGEPSRIEISVPENLYEQIDMVAVQHDDGEYQFKHPRWIKNPKKENGKIILEHTFPREDSYIIHIYKAGTDAKGKKLPPFEFQRIYALNEDLVGMYPYKGDIHMHTKYSDGKSSVENMVTKCLELGLGFQAISDHRKYQASEVARKIFDPLPISIKCINAEECHQNPAPHVHSLGANGSLHDYIDANREKFDTLVEKILKELPKDLTEQEALSVARAEAQFEMIRKLDGLAGLNHPYWRMGEKTLHLTKRVVEVLCQRHKFDYFEIINSGCSDDSTDLAMEQYAQMREDGYTTPIIANSDAHSLKGLGESYTIVFSKSNNWQDVRDAIVSRQNVAVEAFDKKQPRIIGRIRFIQYAYFLYQYFFPLTDKICAEQAKLLRIYLKKQTSENKNALAKKSVELQNLYKEFFGY